MAKTLMEIKKPEWVKCASNHALISSRELCEWLGIKTHSGLRKFLNETDFPPPRIGNKTGSKLRRWRVGDIRAWLAQSERLTDELAEPMGEPGSHTRNGISTDKAFGFGN